MKSKGISGGVRCAALMMLGAALCGGCGAAENPNVVVSVINVTPFELQITVSGLLGETVDTVERTVATIDSTDIAFVCVDELIVGDPLSPDDPGATLDTGAETPAAFPPFTVRLGEAYRCGDVLEIIVSGDDGESFAVDVFALTPGELRSP